MTLDTVVGIASMRKPSRRSAALQLVEEGRLRARRAARRARLPGLAAASRSSTASTTTAAAPAAAPAADHAAPLADAHAPALPTPTWNAAPAALQQRADASLGADGSAPLVFDPGERWEYGLGIDWVGRLVEHVSGQSLEDYFRDAHPRPARHGRHRASCPARPARPAGRRHSASPTARCVAVEVTLPDRPTSTAGGGGLYSTGPDYLRFLRMLLRRRRARRRARAAAGDRRRDGSQPDRRR